MRNEVVWGLYTRLLAAVYLVAFASLRAQVLAWAGSRGITPVGQKLARLRADVGLWRAIARHPTLLWIS